MWDYEKSKKKLPPPGGPPVTSFSEVGFSKFDIWTLKTTQNGAKTLENGLNLGKIDFETQGGVDDILKIFGSPSVVILVKFAENGIFDQSNMTSVGKIADVSKIMTSQQIIFFFSES